MRKAISKALRYENKEYPKVKRQKIVRAENYSISTLFAFLENSQYNICLNGVKCNSVDDIRKIIALQQFNTYEFSKQFHLTQYYNFTSRDKGLQIKTLEKWLEFFGIDCKLIKE